MVNRAWEGGRLSKSYSDIDPAVLEPSYDSFSFKNLLGAQESGWLSGHLAPPGALDHVQERLMIKHDYNCIWEADCLVWMVGRRSGLKRRQLCTGKGADGGLPSQADCEALCLQ